MRKLTITEAAQKAGVGERKIKAWMDRGILDYSRVDNFIFIDSRDLQKAMNKDGNEFLGCMYNKWVEAGRLEK
jgi:hypothetical protein